jgi:hypothetical protein
MKSRVFAYNAIQPRPAARAQAVGFSSTCPWRIGIATTIFRVGAAASAHNPVDNVRSPWDREWMVNYGGLDTPDSSHRQDLRPSFAFLKEYTRLENRAREQAP